MNFTSPSFEIMNIPFSESDELYSKLNISEDGFRISRALSVTKSPERLSGEAQVLLCNAQVDLASFLTKELTTPDLNKFHPYLWMVGTQSSTHITPLTEQSIKERANVLTEVPELHLLWVNDRIYLKPIPKYLLSHAFWSFFLTNKASPLTSTQQTNIANAARGFLRSYAFLIQHKSDFKLAQSKDLISPKIRYSKFINCISTFEGL